jgi:hypothetical protein
VNAHSPQLLSIIPRGIIMFKKICLTLAGLLAVSQAHAWDFRGEPNGWGTTRMTFVGASRHFIRQSFSATQDEFKIASDSGWATAFPAQNFVVAPGKTYDITFFENTKVIQADEVGATENWVFRGTTNNWGITPMTKSGGVFTICQNFGSNDPRFKISNGNKGSWVEAYPESDFRVPLNASIDITFNPATRGIQTSVRSTACGVSNVVLDSDRSLLVHDLATLNGADPAETVNNIQLFARFWDTQNVAPGFVPGGPKCTGLLNGFTHECRSQEGFQAQTPNDFIGAYIPLALVNRFDLRDKVNFSNCGENRIIYGLANRAGRNFIIFEAQMPNPTPGSASGCAPIVNFWKNLSAEPNAANRAAALRSFYFSGIASQNVRPVIDIRNYTTGAGQIRTNQFMGFSWLLKEFQTAVEGNTSIIKPVSVKANPFGQLFNGTRVDTLAVDFRNQFLANMSSLLISDLSTFSLTVQNNAHNNGQSHASGDTTENAYASHVTTDFSAAIQNRATQLGSSLTAAQIVNRATAMTCGGCHQPSSFGLTSANSVGPGQTWPDTLSFTHVSEFSSNGSFPLSPALQNVFLPARKTDLQNFIKSLGGATAAAASLSIQSFTSEPAPTPPLVGKRSG